MKDGLLPKFSQQTNNTVCQLEGGRGLFGYIITCFSVEQRNAYPLETTFALFAWEVSFGLCSSSWSDNMTMPTVALQIDVKARVATSIQEAPATYVALLRWVCFSLCPASHTS